MLTAVSNDLINDLVDRKSWVATPNQTSSAGAPRMAVMILIGIGDGLFVCSVLLLVYGHTWSW